MSTKYRGFASMTPEQRKAIASKGGQKVSQDSAHMAAIGIKGGRASAASRKQASEQKKSI